MLVAVRVSCGPRGDGTFRASESECDLDVLALPVFGCEPCACRARDDDEPRQFAEENADLARKVAYVFFRSPT